MEKRTKKRAAAAFRRMLEAAKELADIEKQHKRRQTRKGGGDEPIKH